MMKLRILIFLMLVLVASPGFSMKEPEYETVEPIKTTLRIRQPNWKFRILSFYESGLARCVVFYRPIEGGKDEPVKEVIYNEEGHTIVEKDLTCISKDYPQAKKWGTTVVPHGVSEAYHSSGELKRLAYYDRGLLHGPFMNLNEDAQVELQCMYYQGEKHGRWRSFYPTGALKEERFYNCGRRVLDWSTYNPDGVRTSLVTYRNGVPEGKLVFKNAQGNLLRELYCTGGLLNSLKHIAAKTCYYPDRQIKEKLGYRYGQPVGVYQEFYSNGQLKSKVRYQLGEKHGNEAFFSMEGQELGKGVYDHGRRVGLFEKKHLNGERAFFAMYSEDPLLPSTVDEFYPSGAKKKHYQLLDGKVHSEYTEWSENGYVLKRLNFHEGKEEGKQSYYYPSGDLEEEYFVLNGDFQGLHKKWDPKGSLVYQGSYQEGIKEGVFLEFSDNGVKRKEEHYLSGKLHGPSKAWSKKGQLMASTVYTNGEKQGKDLAWTEDGTLILEARYVEGTPDGAYQEWYPNGQKKRVAFYKNCKQEQEDLEYFPSGTLKVQKHFQNGLLHGKSFEYFEEGALKREEDYLNGQPIGEHITYFAPINAEEQNVQSIFRYHKGKMHGLQELYFENGDEEAKITYLNGVLHGRKRSWDEVSGELLEDEQYQHGRLEGRCFQRLPDGREAYMHYSNGMRDGNYIEFYAPNDRFGRVKALEAEYHNDQLQGNLIEYAPDGIKRACTQYKNNLRDGLFTFYDKEGALIKSIEYLKGKKHGKWLEFYPTGKLFLQASFKDNLQEGEKLKYYESGQLASSSFYRSGKRHGVSKQWSEEGALTFEGSYKNGLRNGVFNKFYEDGSPRVAQSYKNDQLHGLKIVYDEDGAMQESFYENGELVTR